MNEKVPAIPAERQAEILRYLGMDPDDVATEALVAICNRYGFDPLLKHVVLIGDKGRKNTYVTRDGLLYVAHQSHQLDGVVVVEEGSDDSEWWAVVEVYRKDMSHPFRFRGRYSKSAINKKYGPEMAVKCAEVMALRRAFNVALPTVEEQWDTLAHKVVRQAHEIPDPEVVRESEAYQTGVDNARAALAAPTDYAVPVHDIDDMKGRLNAAPGPVRKEFRDLHGDIDDMNTTDLLFAIEWVEQHTQSVEPF